MNKNIRDIFIDELILSNTIKQYWKDINYDMTDLQWLNFIIHNYKSINSLYKLLDILQSNTKYKRIQNCINKIVQCQENAIKEFKENINNKYIYEIKLQNQYNTYDVLGYTNTWANVLKISKDMFKNKYTTNIIIQKIKLLVPSKSIYMNDYIGSIQFNNQLEIIYCNTKKHDIYFNVIAHTSMDKGVLFKHPFKYKDHVYDQSNNKIGTIIRSTKLNAYKNFINHSYENILFTVKYDNEVNDTVNMFNLDLI